MCGIVGLWRKSGPPPGREEMDALAGRLRHRGPDASGVAVAGRLGLGHRRLKIIDLSDAANQPFTRGRHTLVFNGEIFNYRQLRRELEPFFPFATASDTEVLFHALVHWGRQALDRLDGQFAFAFHDAGDNTLLLARDHVGICPLYTYEDATLFAFGSEIAPLLALAGPRPLDPQGVADYFTYRYNIQNGRTLFDGIRRFDPGTSLLLDLGSGQRQSGRYWTLRFGTPLPPQEVAGQLETVLDAAMADQSVADVPVGMFLSGGIDSRAVLHGFARNVGSVEAFTLRFGPDDPEMGLVDDLEKRYPLHRHVPVFDQTVAEALPRAVRMLEEPFGDIIICANALLARRAADVVRVVLSGEGGDESFFGYAHQRSFLRLLGLHKGGLPSSLMALGLAITPPALLGRLADYPGGFGASEARHLRRVAGRLSDPGEAYLSLVSLFAPQDLDRLLAPGLRRHGPAGGDGTAIRAMFAAHDHPLHASMRAEVEQLTLVVNLLKQDRFTMAHGLEARVPLVARPVLELAARLPLDVLAGRPAKAVLQRYSRGQTLPKRPFSVFASPSYRTMLAGLYAHYAAGNTVGDAGVLNPAEVDRIGRGLASGGLLDVKRAMAVLVFMVWLTVFADHLKQ